MSKPSQNNQSSGSAKPAAMADTLTQLQDAAEAFAHQMAASVYFTLAHHDLSEVNATDRIREIQPTEKYLDPYPKADFENGKRELAKDLVMREQQIELLISTLPGLDQTPEQQENRIKELEEELKVEEEKRKEAVKDKELLLAKLEEAIRSIRRP